MTRDARSGEVKICQSAQISETKTTRLGYKKRFSEILTLFEISGVSEEVAKEAMRLASHKLPINTRFIVKETGLAAGSESRSREPAQVES